MQAPQGERAQHAKNDGSSCGSGMEWPGEQGPAGCRACLCGPQSATPRVMAGGAQDRSTRRLRENHSEERWGPSTKGELCLRRGVGGGETGRLVLLRGSEVLHT